MTVPANAKVAQFTVRTPNTTADLDLYVHQIVDGSAVQVGQSATGAANETVVLPAPETGDYLTQVIGYANAPGTTSTPATFRREPSPRRRIRCRPDTHLLRDRPALGFSNG